MSDLHLPSQTEQSIVLVGWFSPAMFHPYWFVAHELIRPSDIGSEEKTLIVSGDVTRFSSGWFEFRATRNRLSLHSSDPSMDLPLRDLMRGTVECLGKVPVTAYGFNCDQVFLFESREQSHRVIDAIAPKSAWNPLLANPMIQQIQVTGEDAGHTMKFRVDVDENAVKISANQHYTVHGEIDDDDFDPNSSQSLIESLIRDWEQFLTYARDASSKLLAIGLRSK